LVEKASFSKDFRSEFHRRYRPSCHGDIFGALLQISSLPTMCPLRCGALDMCSTARIFRLKHNICMQRISMMLNPGRCGMGYRGRGAWVLRRCGPHTNNARSTWVFFSFSSPGHWQTTQKTHLTMWSWVRKDERVPNAIITLFLGQWQ